MADNEKNADGVTSQLARLEIQMTSLSEKVEDQVNPKTVTLPPPWAASVAG